MIIKLKIVQLILKTIEFIRSILREKNEPLKENNRSLFDQFLRTMIFALEISLFMFSFDLHFTPVKYDCSCTIYQCHSINCYAKGSFLKFSNPISTPRCFCCEALTRIEETAEVKKENTTQHTYCRSNFICSLFTIIRKDEASRQHMYLWLAESRTLPYDCPCLHRTENQKSYSFVKSSFSSPNYPPVGPRLLGNFFAHKYTRNGYNALECHKSYRPTVWIRWSDYQSNHRIDMVWWERPKCSVQSCEEAATPNRVLCFLKCLRRRRSP